MGNRVSIDVTVMSATLLVPAIAAFSALVVALVSAWLTRRNSRDLELLKSALTGREASRGVVRDETRQVLHHLEALVASIQKLKDAALVLVAAPDGNQQMRSSRVRFEAAAAAVGSTFAEAAASLSKAEHTTAQDARRVVIELEQRLAKSDTDALPAGVRWELDTRRLELTALQTELRDARTKRLLRVADVGG